MDNSIFWVEIGVPAICAQSLASAMGKNFYLREKNKLHQKKYGEKKLFVNHQISAQ
jgi:hypothetical protein